MTPADVESAVAVGTAALAYATGEPDADRLEWQHRRVRQFLDEDPGGAWVAEDDGEVVGVTLAVLREGVWGLSWFGVRPDRQARGVGRALLEATLGYGAPHRGGIIASATDPKAMRRYARAGFALLPCVALSGIPARAAVPAGLRSRAATVDAAAPVAAAAGRRVRGAAYSAADLALVAAPPNRVFVLGADGIAVMRDEEVVLLAAPDEPAAQDLLWTCLAAVPRGGTFGLTFVTHGQDWAIAVALAAGLALSPDGPLFVRGELGPLRPWLPSGAVL